MVTFTCCCMATRVWFPSPGRWMNCVVWWKVLLVMRSECVTSPVLGSASSSRFPSWTSMTISLGISRKGKLYMGLRKQADIFELAPRGPWGPISTTSRNVRNHSSDMPYNIGNNKRIKKENNDLHNFTGRCNETWSSSKTDSRHLCPSEI